MPTYQYKCPECAHEFEEFQPITDKAIEKCPACGEKTRRLITGGAGLIFKGSGFYITDYRSDSYNKSAKADAGSSKAESSGGSSTNSGSGTTKKTDSKASSATAASTSKTPNSSTSSKKDKS